MNNQNVLKGNFPSATCLHCGKVTNISFSHDFRQLVSKNKTLSELNNIKRLNMHKWMDIKNGQIQVMHKMVAQLITLLNEEQKEKAKQICQEMRDLIKKTEKQK